MEIKERGKNIIVSRRVLMEEEREKKSKRLSRDSNLTLSVKGR